MSKKVIIVAANGYSSLLNPSTCEAELMEELSHTFRPLRLGGRELNTLSELREHVTGTNGSGSTLEPGKHADIANMTNLNGIVLADFVAKAGFEPIMVNDFTQDREVLDEALEEDLLAAGISTTFLPFREHVDPVTSYIRERRPEVPIVLGGPTIYLSHSLFRTPDPTYTPEALRRLYFFFENDPKVDYYVIDRRGEETLVALLQALDEGRNTDFINNLAIRSNGSIDFTPLKPELVSIQKEFVDWDAISDSALKHTVSLRASTGCPFKCEFCNFHFFAPELMTKPTEALVRELEQLAKRSQVKHISFVDDNFLISPKRVREFAESLIDRDFPFTWSSFIRPDSIRRDNIETVANSGIHLPTFGVESGDETILKNMNKRSKIDHVLEVVSGLGQRGVSTSSTMIVGFPGETEETLGNTIQFLNSYQASKGTVHWFSPFVFMLLPKIFIEKHRDKYGIKGFMLNWEHDTMNIHQAAKQLRRLMLEAEGALFPRSAEYPFASDLLDLQAVDAERLIRLIDEHIKNQVRSGPQGDSTYGDRNRQISEEISRILQAASPGSAVETPPEAAAEPVAAPPA